MISSSQAHKLTSSQAFILILCGLQFSACNLLGGSSYVEDGFLQTASGGGATSSGGSCTAGTATAADALAGVTFPDGSGGMTTGTMTNRGSWSLSGASAVAAPTFPGAGYYSGITNAPATSNYCAGTYINGSNGTALCASGATTGTTIAAAQVCTGYSGYNLAGSAINGSRTCSDVGTPSTISGLILWLKADDLTDMYADADAISVWRDASGSRNDAFQSTIANRPLLKTNILNSKPVVRFDGINDNMLAGSKSSTMAAFSTFAVFIIWRRSGDAGVQVLLNIGDAASAAGSRWEVLSKRLADTNASFDTFYGATANVDTNDAANINTWYMTSALRVTTSSKQLYTNGTLASSGGDSANALNATTLHLMHWRERQWGRFTPLSWRHRRNHSL